MDVHLLYNPRSGAGRARLLAARFESSLRSAGIPVFPSPTHDDRGALNPPPKPGLLEGSLLAVIGGDGTIHHAAPLAAQSGAALYHIPAGTENLFARHHGMDASPETLIRALRSPRIIPMDLGACNDHPFVLMASIGPDASVIHRLDGTRTGPIKQSSYLVPILREFFDPQLPRLDVVVDGEPWLRAARGILVVGNSPHYAWRLNPARQAVADDGFLDAAFYPCETIADTMGWAANLLVQRSGSLSGAPARRGRRLVAHSLDGPARLQMDGEVPPRRSTPDQGTESGQFSFEVRPGVLKVLSPIANLT